MVKNIEYIKFLNLKYNGYALVPYMPSIMKTVVNHSRHFWKSIPTFPEPVRGASKNARYKKELPLLNRFRATNSLRICLSFE